MIKQQDIDAVLEANHIEDVVSAFIPLTRKGSKFTACCPFHDEKTPSFIVTPNKEMYKCFGCGKGGNAITFLQESQGMTFREAVQWLADKAGLTIDDDDTPRTAEDIAAQRKREAMFVANAAAAAFFAKQIHADTPEAKSAMAYATNRWSKKFVEEEDIGFAPGRGAFHSWALENAQPIDLLKELGLLREKDGRTFDGYYNRIVIPIKERYGRIIGFTARNLNEDGPKYINSPESESYHKEQSIFGEANAIRQGASEQKFYLVEGAPDVMKLQSIGIYNTVASLGSAWTDKQLLSLKRYNPTLCFIPDIDPPKEGERFGTGVKAVMKNGLRAFELGFTVTVKEIQDIEPGKKADPDSYITSKAVLAAIPEDDFVTWYAEKLSAGKETTAEKSEVVRDVARMLAKCGDTLRVKMYAKQLGKIIKGTSSLWMNAINEAAQAEDSKKSKNRSRVIDQDLYQKYGLCERNNCYFSLNGEGGEKEWSNFSMLPLFHIKDQINPKRLFKIKNFAGLEEIVEFKQEELVSLKSFRMKIEGLGNFLWSGKEEQLMKLKAFLYEATETAVEITQLGWQRDGFYAFGNGAYYLGEWNPTDEMGIVRLYGMGNFYIPAASVMFRKDTQLFQFERRFIHTPYNSISLRDYTDLLVDVFGNNAKVGICFLLATLFRDVVAGVTKNFPILNLCGPKGSGKSEMGHSLMSFFILDNRPPNLQNATDAELADSVAQCANALIHLDEYKNSIDLTRREFLKGLYDGTGRTRMNMDRDKKRETTAVDCGVCVSGQEMPTIDIALFSRMLFCPFDSTEFTIEAKRKFDKLAEIRRMGCTHLTLEIIRHRKMVEDEFARNYKRAMEDLMAAIEGESIEDRILRNWIVPLAMLRTLGDVINLGFDYKNMLSVCRKYCVRQNSECSASNELSTFWQTVDFLHQNGEIFFNADYRIKYETTFKGKGMKEAMQFKSPRPILYLCIKRVIMLYKRAGKLVGDTVLPQDSLRNYLEISKEYLGIKPAMRFKNLANPKDMSIVTTNAFGQPQVESTQRVDWALAFDYWALSEKYGINLEVEAHDETAPAPEDIDTEDKSIPY